MTIWRPKKASLDCVISSNIRLFGIKRSTRKFLVWT